MLGLAKAAPNMSAPENLEPRVVKLEIEHSHMNKSQDDLRNSLAKQREEQRSDFRLLFGAIVASSLGLAGLIAKSAGWF